MLGASSPPYLVALPHCHEHGTRVLSYCGSAHLVPTIGGTYNWGFLHWCCPLYPVSNLLRYLYFERLLTAPSSVYGITCCQTFYYFRSEKGQQDHWYLKALVCDWRHIKNLVYELTLYLRYPCSCSSARCKRPS